MKEFQLDRWLDQRRDRENAELFSVGALLLGAVVAVAMLLCSCTTVPRRALEVTLDARVVRHCQYLGVLPREYLARDASSVGATHALDLGGPVLEVYRCDHWGRGWQR